MVQAEAWLVCNMALCACALPLGGRLAGLPAPAPRRLITAAGMGGLCALLALWLPPILMLGSLPLGVWLCYANHGMEACIRCTVTTLGATVLSGGAAEMVFCTGAAPISAVLAAVALSTLMYLLISLMPGVLREVRQVELSVGDYSVMLPAMVDSGNLLRDPITAKPVLVAPARAVRALFPDTEDIGALEELPHGFRLLNVRTAAGGTLLPMFRPDTCRLYLDGRCCETELLVAVAGKEYAGVQALVPLSALPQGIK